MDTYLVTNQRKQKSMKIKIVGIYLLAVLIFSSCRWENDNTEAIYDLFFVERNGAQMAAHVHGNIDSKVFVVILHGGPGGTGLQYRSGVFSDVIEQNYAVVYFDQRGQGMSQGHLDVENTNVKEMVEDVKALASTIKFKYGEDNSLFLLGHSWGGTLGSAYMTTEDYQNEFKGWIEVDGAHDFDLMVKAQKRIIPEVGNTEIQMDRDVEFWTEFIEIAEKIDSNSYDGDDVFELNSRSFTAESNLTAAEVIVSDEGDPSDIALILKSNALINNPFTTFFTGNLTNASLVETDGIFTAKFNVDLSKIEIPTLLLWGRYDFVVPAELGDQALREISSENKKLVVFEASGHSPMDNESMAFGNELIDFIEAFK